jgi:glutathione S-transferase
VHPARRKGLDHARSIYSIADERLGVNEWALGAYSIADIHLFRLYWRYRTHHSRPLNADDYPHLEAHFTRMMARPAVRRTIEAETEVGYELPW